MKSNNEPTQIGARRELFWDDFLIDSATAVLTQHHPIPKEISLHFDAPWEGSSCGYPVVFRDGDVIRLYYIAGNFNENSTDTSELTGPCVVCYAESHDNGRTFEKPDLGLFEYEGSKHNNIIMMTGDYMLDLDNFAVFRDLNPQCPLDEKYKAIAQNAVPNGGRHDRVLTYMKSADGIHFSPGRVLFKGSLFDSLNCCFWDTYTKQYYIYMRDWFEGYPRERKGYGTRMRGIRFRTSPDFVNWSDDMPIDLGQGSQVELYTNVIKPYYRADHIFLGMPTRYVEREGWMPNHDLLPNPEKRKNRSRISMRLGTALTDNIIITSRDGIHFNRSEEAFMTPGAERDGNWVYGDCYPSWGMVQTDSDLPGGAADEISFYASEYHWIKPQTLRRYSIRQDGFYSFRAGSQQSSILTKPFIFEGKRLSINFATSAAGFIQIDILDANANKIPGFSGFELFGDNVDRTVEFMQGHDVSKLAGKPIRLQITMSEADIFSFCFDNDL